MESGEPRHLVASARATKLLERYGVTTPRDIRLDDIAWDLGIEISYLPLKGAAAHLVRIGESGAITVNQGIVEEGSRRFAVAHELGHWILHPGLSQVFLCTTDDLRDYEKSVPELEANTFASELLMPRFLLPKELWRHESTLWQAQRIASTFDVTVTSAAIRWTQVANEPVFVVFSDGSNVGWWRRHEPKVAGVWLESKQTISVESLAHAIGRGDNVAGATTIEVPWEVWFPHLDSRCKSLWESSMKLGNYGTVVTILWIPDLS